MSSLRSSKLKHIPSEITVPGDKSISHRAVMFAGLCDGVTQITNFLPSDDCLASMNAMVALGVDVDVLGVFGWLSGRCRHCTRRR